MKTEHEEEIFICPRCKVDMKKLKKRDVILDICHKCGGMWLDKDEIEQLVKLAEEMKE
jgi:Zn-finger nucleic acid-binding protein